MPRLDRLACLLIAIPGIIALTRLGLMIAHPSFLTVLTEHIVSQIAR